MPAEPFDPFAAVLQFHRRFAVSIGDRPALPREELVALRLALIDEELAELRAAIGNEDMVAVADALADLLYVTYGAAITFGIDLRPIFEEVHRANMAKLGGGTRADGKVLKPDGWQPPDLAPLLERVRLSREEA
jgi:predicted HAD superfamily Cof-like phosphohydrolase